MSNIKKIVGSEIQIRERHYHHNTMKNKIKNNSIRKALIAVSIVVLAVIAFMPSKTITYKAEPAPASTDDPSLRSSNTTKHLTHKEIEAIQKKKAQTVLVKLEQKLKPEEAKIALAIIKQESSLRNDAKNYNCFYVGDIVYSERVKNARSKSCKHGHEKYAYSVDCGITQVNFKGQSCPDYSLTLDWSLDKMAEMHKERGFNPWVAYTSKAYLQYLE